MSTSTLATVQRLNDAEFHRLCDELIPRINSRYYALTPHGVSSEGASIKGQPDSFVGSTIETAEIALCYSTQKRRWWTKLLNDVQAAKEACLFASEVVWATSRDTERDEHRPADWLSNAEAASGSTTLTVFGGRRLSHLLDTEHQDLRFEYLGIPQSRLSYESLVLVCRRQTSRATQDLEAARRYDPQRYVVRRADGTLFEMWQACGRVTSARVRPRLIPIVSEAGLGKTSLLCRFAESFSPRLPLLFVVARDMSWDVEDAIVRYVIQTAEGVLEASIRSGEEQSIARLMHLRWPFTVVIDGLDETYQPEHVRRALRYWLRSPLADESILIVSSRPQFWALCEDATWEIWIPTHDRRTPGEERENRGQPSRRGAGFLLPDLLNAQELEAAWARAGRPTREFLALSSDVRVELSHPFTLRAFLELQPSSTRDLALTRASILDRWIEQRLRDETVATEFLTPEVYQQTLMGLARLLKDSRGWVDFEDLHGLPRYDPVCPPGPAIERLLAAGLVEASASRMQIRFGHEAVADFFMGELDANRTVDDPDGAAKELLARSYSRVALRLAVVGRHVKQSTPPVPFIEGLARVDPARAVVVMQGAPNAFDSRLKATVVSSLATEISGRFEARAGYAVDLLSRYHCAEARTALVDHLHPVARCPDHLRNIGALSVARAAAVEAADVTYYSSWFQYSESYYFGDVVHVLRSSSAEFRKALALLAAGDLEADPGSKEHVRAVHVLGYLGDDRLVEHLVTRFEAVGELTDYENHALIAIGTSAAAKMFARSANAAAMKIVDLGWEDGGIKRWQVFNSISPLTADLRHLFTPVFEKLVREWLVSTSDVPREESPARELKLMALSLAQTSRSRHLARLYVMAKEPYRDQLAYDPVLEWLDPRDWSDWWSESADVDERQALVRALPGVPTLAVEAALLEALRYTRVAWHAARYLGDSGSAIAKSALRKLATDVRKDEFDEFTRIEAVRALGKLRDQDAVGLLDTIARTSGPRMQASAATSLALIGTPGSESVLVGLLDASERTQPVAGALVIHGSYTAVRKAIDLCNADPARGSKWLVKAVNNVLFGWGWRRGRYFTHIDNEFGVFLREQEPQFEGSENREYFRLLERIDSESIRVVLRDLAQRTGIDDQISRGTDGQSVARVAYDELFERGDSWALPELIRQCLGEDRPFARFMAGRLQRFQREEVAEAIRSLLNRALTPVIRAELVRLLGFFGTTNDAESLRRDVQGPNDVLANAADEALLRLTDPLRLLGNWSNLHY